MSYQPFYGYPPQTCTTPVFTQPVYPPQTCTTPVFTQPVYPPQGYPVQACNPSAYGTGMQPVQTRPVRMHPTQLPPVPEQSTIPRQPRPSDRKRSKREAFDAYDYALPSRRPEDHSRRVDEDAYYSKFSAATFTESVEAIETRDDYHKEPKKSTRPRQVHTEADSSKLGHSQSPIKSQQTGADKPAKRSSAKPSGTEPKHTTYQSTRTPHLEPDSRRNNHSRRDGRDRTRPKQSLHSKKAVAYQDEDDANDGKHAYYSSDDTAVGRAPAEAEHVLDEYRKEPTASVRRREVQIEEHSSKVEHARRHNEPQQAGADKQAKGSSSNPARTERKHTTNRSTRTLHPEPESKRRPEKPGVQAKERRSTNTAGTGRAHTTKDSSNTNSSKRPKESQSGPKITTNEHEGSSVKINYDPNQQEIGISTPREESASHRTKEKPKESSRPSGRTKPMKETVPDYYAIIGCPMNSDAPAISKQIKRKQLEVHPDKRVTSDMSEQEVAEINKEAALVNEAAEVLRDAPQKKQYDQLWRHVYGNTVRR